MIFNSNDVVGEITRLAGLDISLGYRYPEMFSYLMNGHKPILGTGASSGKTVQNDPAVTHVGPQLTPAVATFTSDDAADAFGGLGAQLVVVLGVNSDGFFEVEAVPLDGTSPASTVGSYYVIDNAVVVLEGASGQQGTIVADINGQSQGAILAELRALLTGHFLVPINYNLYLAVEMHTSTSNVKNTNFIQFDVFNGGTTSIVGSVNQVDKAVEATYVADAPIILPAGTYVRVVSSGNSGDSSTVLVSGFMVHTSVNKSPLGHILGAPPGSVYNYVG